MLLRSCILLFVLLTGCRNVAPNTSPTPISKKNMVKLLTEITLAEAGSDPRNLSRTQFEAELAQRYAHILQKHGVSYEQFTTSFQYYLARPAELAALYDEVIMELTSREARLREQANMPMSPTQPPRSRQP